MWEAAVEGFAAKEVEFFAIMELVGIPAAAFALAGLSPSWFYRKMQRDPAFKERVMSIRLKRVGGLLKRALSMAEEDPAMLRYLLDRMGPDILTLPGR